MASKAAGFVALLQLIYVGFLGRSDVWGPMFWVLAALTMGLTFAHTLELPQKLGYDAAMWTSVQHSLYRYFGVIGGPVETNSVTTPVCGSIFVPSSGSCWKTKFFGFWAFFSARSRVFSRFRPWAKMVFPAAMTN